MNELKIITDQSIYQAKWQENNLHILQSWNWGKVKELEKWQVTRLGFYRDEVLTSVYSLQWRSMFGSLIKLAYLAKITEMPADFVLELKKYLKKHGFSFAIIELIEAAGLPQVTADNELIQNYPDHIQPQQSNIIRLGKTETELFMGMDGKYRRNIKKSIREGVTVSLYQYSEVPESLSPVSAFYSVLKEVMANTKFLGRGSDYFQAIWDELGVEGRVRIFLAKYQEQIIGAYMVVNDNCGAYELYGGVTIKGRELEAGYLLKWEAIRYYNQLGLSSYDHWGVAPKLVSGEYDSKDELYQISKFKQGFGGDYVSFPNPQVLIVDSKKYKLFQLGGLLNKTILKIKKKLKRR